MSDGSRWDDPDALPELEGVAFGLGHFLTLTGWWGTLRLVGGRLSFKSEFGTHFDGDVRELQFRFAVWPFAPGFWVKQNGRRTRVSFISPRLISNSQVVRGPHDVAADALGIGQVVDLSIARQRCAEWRRAIELLRSESG